MENVQTEQPIDERTNQIVNELAKCKDIAECFLLYLQAKHPDQTRFNDDYLAVVLLPLYLLEQSLIQEKEAAAKLEN